MGNEQRIIQKEKTKWKFINKPYETHTMEEKKFKLSCKDKSIHLTYKILLKPRKVFYLRFHHFFKGKRGIKFS